MNTKFRPIGLVTLGIAALVACSPRTYFADFDLRLRNDGDRVQDMLVIGEPQTPHDPTTWIRSDDRGNAEFSTSGDSPDFGPSRVVYAYDEDLGLSIFIEGRDYSWDRRGNSDGKSWKAGFRADLDPVNDDVGMRTCDSNGNITFRPPIVDDLLDRHWMTLATGEDEGMRMLECSNDTGLLTCSCPETITDRAFLIQRLEGEDSTATQWLGDITINVITELQLSQ